MVHPTLIASISDAAHPQWTRLSQRFAGCSALLVANAVCTGCDRVTH
jgi:hypothetical protein